MVHFNIRRKLFRRNLVSVRGKARKITPAYRTRVGNNYLTESGGWIENSVDQEKDFIKKKRKDREKSPDSESTRNSLEGSPLQSLPKGFLSRGETRNKKEAFGRIQKAKKEGAVRTPITEIIAPQFRVLWGGTRMVGKIRGDSTEHRGRRMGKVGNGEKGA